MTSKLIIVIIFFGILASLGSALMFLVKDKGHGNRTAKALSIRIGVSVGLFALLFVLYGLGLIQPHGVRP